MRWHGLTVDNLLSVDLVTAEAQRLRVDAETEPELFWGLRGGGGNFGVATAFTYRVHRVGPLVLGGRILWPLSDAPIVLRAVAELTLDAPDELNVVMRLGSAPPSPFVPVERYGTPVLGMEIVWSGYPADGQQTIAGLRAIGTPIVDLVRPVPYLFLQSQADAANPHGRHYYWRSQRLPLLTNDVVDGLLAATEWITSPLSYIGRFVIGGAVTRVDPEATAVGRRDPVFEVNAVAAWSPLDHDGDRHIAWVRRLSDDLRPHSSGVYANFLSDEATAGVEFAYGDRLKRLTALKDRYDPTNVFRNNANIPPSKGRP
jgi:FAD/FMN-containing dehydrogenase